MRRKLLVHGQDLGSVRVLLPVVSRLVSDRRFNVTVMGSGTAAEIFRQGGVTCQVLKNGHSAPLTESAAQRLLRRLAPDAFLCGASHFRDPTNARLINACRTLGIRTVGFLDHWKNLERFTAQPSQNGSLVPDVLGVMDAPVRDALVRLGLNRDQIFLVGHPYLEEIFRARRTLSESGRTSVLRRQVGIGPDDLMVLCCSEMLHAHGVSEGCRPSCISLFEVRNQGESLLAQITDATRQVSRGINRRCQVVLRPHPFESEHRRPIRQAGVAIMDQSVCSDIEAVAAADLVVGVSSMPLIQAYVLGKPVASLAFPAVRKRQGAYARRFLWDSDETFTLVRSRAGLSRLLESVANGCWQHSGVTPRMRLVLRGATGRAVRLLERMLQHDAPATGGNRSERSSAGATVLK